MVSTEVPVKTCNVEGCFLPRHPRRAQCLDHFRAAHRRAYQRRAADLQAVPREIPVKTCAVEGCSAPRRLRSRCLEHQRQENREYTLRARLRASKPQRILRSERQCRIDGCTRSVHAKDLCHSHYKTKAIRKPCTIEGCPYGIHAQGLCMTHYTAAYNRKDFQRTQLQGVLTAEERFRSKVQITPACHLWAGTIDRRNGRGYFTYSGSQSAPAHRAGYEFERGPIPTDENDKPLHIDHGCRVPLCVRPDHLEPVPALENSRRSGVAHGRRSFDQRDGWLLFLAIPLWQKGEDNMPACVVRTAS